MKKIGDRYTNNIFENIKHIDEYGNEYWYARELQKVLEYKDWRNFQKVIDKAVLSANNSVSSEEDWVVEVNKPIKTGKGKEEIIKDYKLSRYICYLIVQNADPSKEVVALGQTYFAIQTRKQEITEQEYDSLSDDEKRFYQRKLTKQGNYTLQKVASAAGVKNMAEFHNAGYKGLYNGETADDIFKRKKLRYREDILDNMNEDELVANLFRINQTKQKLLKDNVQGEKEAKDVHYEVGKKVRKAIADIGGMMPEEMPTPKKSLKELERQKKQIENKDKKKLEEMKQFGGNIGYGIRPTERRRGYNKINLYLGLIEAKKIGLDKVMLDCDVENLGSSKTMEALGGKLERTEIDPYDGILTSVYWINVDESLEKYKDEYVNFIDKSYGNKFMK